MAKEKVKKGFFDVDKFGKEYYYAGRVFTEIDLFKRKKNVKAKKKKKLN